MTAAKGIGRCAAILLVALAAGCTGGPSREDPAALAERLERKFERLERRDFAGQLLVAHQGKVLVMRGFGTMSPSGRRPLDAEAVMPLASVTKPITAAAVLALAADDELSLDDPAGRHVPDLAAQWAGVPIRTIMTHTAGLPGEIVNRDFDGTPRFEPVDRETFIRRLNRFHPDHAPGAVFDYSNVGYGLLAALIEIVSGRSFEDFVADELLVPTGIEGIGLQRPSWSAERLVTGREGASSFGHYFDQPMLHDGMGFHVRGAGDLMATPRGVLDWWRSIRDASLLPEPRPRQWLEPRVTEPDGSAYGYGWRFRQGRFGHVIGHTGMVLGFTVDFSWHVDRDLLVYINSADLRFPADELRP